MSLVTIFAAHHDDAGPFKATLSIDGTGVDHEDLEHYLRGACRELGTRCGLRAMGENTYELGFENAAEYQAIMALVEPKLAHSARFLEARVYDLIKMMDEKTGEKIPSEYDGLSSDDWRINPSVPIPDDEGIKYSPAAGNPTDGSDGPV